MSLINLNDKELLEIINLLDNSLKDIDKGLKEVINGETLDEYNKLESLKEKLQSHLNGGRTSAVIFDDILKREKTISSKNYGIEVKFKIAFNEFKDEVNLENYTYKLPSRTLEHLIKKSNIITEGQKLELLSKYVECLESESGINFSDLL